MILSLKKNRFLIFWYLESLLFNGLYNIIIITSCLWGIFILEKTENLDICPFCNANIPQGPAYFCPTCGKKLEDKYSKRKIIITTEESEISSYEDSSLNQTSEDLGFVEDEYGVEDLINDLESDSSDEEEYEDIVLSDVKNEEEDYTIEDLINDLESEEDEEKLEPVLADHLESEEDEDTVDQEGSGETAVIYDVFEDDSSNDLKIKNLSISLEIWLRECVDKGFTGHFLSYKNFKMGKDLSSINAIISNFNENEESSINEIISNFELEEILEYRYKHYFNGNDFKNALMKLFLPIGVITLVDIAKKHNTSISLTKDGLIKNFLQTYSPYELINILNDEGLDIINYLNVPVLEQIYLLNCSQLENISRGKCPNENSSKIDIMACLIKHYDKKFLLSHNKLEGVN